MTYPDGIDALVNVNANDSLAAGGHAARHNSTNTALEEVKNFLASGSANTVLTAGSVVPTWDLVDPVSIANGTAGYVLTAGSAVPTWAPVAAGGKILQVVRATDSTQRTTTSTNYVDASISVSITPIDASSNILVLWQALSGPPNNNYIDRIITNASNVALSGAQQSQFGDASSTSPASTYPVIGWVAATSTSSRTYKGRFRSNTSGTVNLFNVNNTGQMYAIEVSA